MSKFLSIHTLPPGAFTRAQLEGFARAAQEDSAVRGYRAFANLSEGKAVCVIEGPDREAVGAWFQKMGMPCDSITKLELEGDRGVIQEA